MGDGDGADDGQSEAVVVVDVGAVDFEESLTPLATPAAPTVVASPAPMPAPTTREPGAGRVLLTAADGYIADGEGLSPFATDYPAVGNLAPELLAAVQQASTDAARDSVALIITSGWRSGRYQQSLPDSLPSRNMAASPRRGDG